jgi:hypothetical protein
MMMSMEDDGDHSGSSGCGRSMVSFEIALQEGDGEPTSTWESCLLDKKHRSDDDDDDDIDDVLVRRKYPWRRFKAFLRRSLPDDGKQVVWMIFLILFATVLLTVLLSSSTSLSRQRQKQQHVQALNFAGRQDRHVIEHDYFSSTPDREYISDSAPIGHKCLFVCFSCLVVLLSFVRMKAAFTVLFLYVVEKYSNLFVFPVFIYNH